MLPNMSLQPNTIKKNTECNICLDDSTHYVDFCSCNIRTCKDCFKTILKLTDIDRGLGYRFIMKCPVCRKEHQTHFIREVDYLGIGGKEMGDRLLEYWVDLTLDNYCFDNGYLPLDSDEDSDEDSEVLEWLDEYDFTLQYLTGF